MMTYREIHRPGLLIALLGAFLAGPVGAQIDNLEGPNAPELRLSMQAALRQFDTPAGEQYTIGDGDELEIQVANRPELSGHHLVGPDGRITLPYSGPFDIKNLSRDQAASGISTALSQYYTSPSVTVRVSKYGSNRIVVLGHVAQPGVLYFENAPTLLEALSRTRIPSAKSDANGKTADADSLPNRCALFRGKDEVVWIEVKSMLDQGLTAANIRLRRDDVLYVPDEDQQEDLVTVLGEVQRPGLVKIQSTTTLLEVLAKSGGLTPDSGSAKIEVFRPSNHSTWEVGFKDLVNPEKFTEVSFQRGDVVYVQKSSFAKFEYIVDKIAPLGTIMLFGSTIAGNSH